MDRALNIFLRYPERGMIKTRLAARLGHEFVHALYLNFLRDIFATAGRVRAHVIVTYASGEGQDEAAVSREWGYPSLRQEGKDLGERMYNSLKTIFLRGYETCILVGSDIPDLPPEIIETSFQALDAHDYVMGPSEDGGYYLLGTKIEKLHESVFQGIPWSTGRVREDTVLAMEARGYRCRMLAPWRDIDDVDDLRAFFLRNLPGSQSSFTMRFLSESGIFRT